MISGAISRVSEPARGREDDLARPSQRGLTMLREGRDYYAFAADEVRDGETADAFRTLAENPSHLIVVHDCFSNRSSQRSNPRRRTLEALTDLDPFIPVLLIVRPQDNLDYPSTLLADLVLTEPVATSALLEGIELLLSETLLERSQRKSGHIALFR